jgi:glycosyltransferase involved in cell wall biosynthesis
MNLTIVSPFPPAITGIGQYGYHIVRGLAQSGRFSSITVLAGRQPGQQDESLEIPLSPSVKVDYAWQRDHLDAGPAILSALRRLEPDLVWYNLGNSVFGRSPLANLSGFWSLGQVKRAGIPVVVTLHEMAELADLKTLGAPSGPLARLGARLFTHLSTQADVVCFTMRRYMEWLSVRKPYQKSVCIPLGTYQEPERLPESEIPELLFFNTLAPYKGLEVLLTAYRALLPHNPALRLTIAGAEHPRFPGYSQSLQREYSALPGIRWLGQVPENSLRELFSRAQIVALPYTASTGSSSVLYRAAMWGRAMVASDLPETQSVAAERGLKVEFFSNRDPAGLARAIQVLLDAPDMRRAQADHNYTAIQRGPLEETCYLYLQAFNQALALQHKPERIDIPAVVPVESP